MNKIMNQELRVLMVEDNEDDAFFVKKTIEKNGYKVNFERVATREGMEECLKKQTWDIIICDFGIPGFGGFEALKTVSDLKIEIPFILVSGTIGEETAVSAMKAGASDYVMKGNLSRLMPAIERELKESWRHQEKKQMELALEESERQLRQAQKMEAVGRLAGGIAHDFNNLLAVILVGCDILAESISKESQIHEEIGQITQAAEQAAALTKQLLAFSRKQVLEFKVYNLNKVIEDTWKMFTHLVDDRISVSFYLEASPWNVKIDPTQIAQVVMNLIVNARDAMPNGGKIHISTKNCTLDEAFVAHHKWLISGDHVCLSVSDTGSGMTQAVLSQIFEPFFTTKEPGKGTGLGLSTAYGIIKQCGGNVVVDSVVDKGTRFDIYFPRVLEMTAASKTDATQALNLTGAGNLLLVEDEPSLRAILEKTLKAQGYNVIACENGFKAIERCRQLIDPIDLIISDVIMPGMNGPDLINALRKINPDLKALLISGYAPERMLEHGPLDEKTFFISKPFKSNQLTEKIQSILNQGGAKS